MKPREIYSILATALLIGSVIAQDQLFECPRGKHLSIFFKILPSQIQFVRYKQQIFFYFFGLLSVFMIFTMLFLL